MLTIRGVLTRDGIAQVAPTMLEKGLSDETINVLKSMMNPTILGFLDATGGDLRKIILEKLTPQITAALQKSVDEVEVYQQTRSIIGSVRQAVRSWQPDAGDADPALQRDRAVRQGGAGRVGDVHRTRHAGSAR